MHIRRASRSQDRAALRPYCLSTGNNSSSLNSISHGGSSGSMATLELCQVVWQTRWKKHKIFYILPAINSSHPMSKNQRDGRNGEQRLYIIVPNTTEKRGVKTALGMIAYALMPSSRLFSLTTVMLL